LYAIVARSAGDDGTAAALSAADRVIASGGVRRRVAKWRATQDKTANTYVIEVAV
jgi:hypothetical protein